MTNDRDDEEPRGDGCSGPLWLAALILATIVWLLRL